MGTRSIPGSLNRGSPRRAAHYPRGGFVSLASRKAPFRRRFVLRPVSRLFPRPASPPPGASPVPGDFGCFQRPCSRRGFGRTRTRARLGLPSPAPLGVVDPRPVAPPGFPPSWPSPRPDPSASVASLSGHPLRFGTTTLIPQPENRKLFFRTRSNSVFRADLEGTPVPTPRRPKRPAAAADSRT